MADILIIYCVSVYVSREHESDMQNWIIKALCFAMCLCSAWSLSVACENKIFKQLVISGVTLRLMREFKEEWSEVLFKCFIFHSVPMF
jgi:hypothetical protein